MDFNIDTTLMPRDTAFGYAFGLYFRPCTLGNYTINIHIGDYTLYKTSYFMKEYKRILYLLIELLSGE